MSKEDASKRDPQTFALIGAAMEVHRQLGHGFLEAVYKEALAIELTERGIPFQREVQLDVYYKGKLLDCKYQSDFLCYGDITLEAKAMADLAGSHRAQTINYLKATKKRRGLLINFGRPSLQYERLVFGFDDLPEQPEEAQL